MNKTITIYFRKIHEKSLLMLGLNLFFGQVA